MTLDPTLTDEELAEMEREHEPFLAIVNTGAPSLCRRDSHLWPCPIFRLVAALRASREEIDEYAQLTDRLSFLLTGTANALKGDPGPLTLHDWSDLPAVAAGLIARLRSEAEVQID